MKFGYTIIYVPDVSVLLRFFETGFGFSGKFLDESGSCGELDTGETTLAFAAHQLGDMNFPACYVSANLSPLPLGIEIGFVSADVENAHALALDAEAIEISTPKAMPWGQIVSYLRCPDGTLVEHCHPVVS